MACAAEDSIEWRYYGADAYGSKYSPASQIHAGNVNDLEIAWTWTSPDQELAEALKIRVGLLKVTPLMVGGVLYLSTSLNQVVALDAGTGKTKWRHDPKAYRKGRPANSGWQHRGLAYWESDDGEDRRILMATGTGELLALNALTGERIDTFGNDGAVDLHTNIIRNAGERRHLGNNAAPIVVKDVIVTSCIVRDFASRIEWPRCPVRGFDVRTGRLMWAFNTLAQEGEPGVETWEEESWRYGGGANAWATFSADPELGYVYVATGTPHNDWYGGHRKGDNHHAESLICIDVTTGKVVWKFQAIHHGLWDYDFAAAPTLANVVVDGKPVKIVAQVSKQAFTYVFDRVTGEPVWPIEERAVPQTDVPGEKTSLTQPFPTKPPPFARQGVTEDDLIDFTPELRAAAIEIMKDFVMGPIYTPPSLLKEDGTGGVMQVPSAAGGANWGGAGVDPETGILYVEAGNMFSMAGVAPTKGGEGVAGYTMGRSKYPRGPEGLPILKPPYGTVTAIDLNLGTIAWQVPHGEGPTDHAAIKHLNLPPLGASSHSGQSNGGPLVTKTLLFVNQVQVGGRGFSQTERFLRAFDKSNGEVLWEQRMNLAPHGTPMTYVHAGRQYVVVAAGGVGEEAQLVAFALPQ
jgi:quinoprotein glucose dehydrogenase|tara:strand:+ start:1258 stop:3153 length:1896 start_codon:yes stop_codon:yes gene_type:complete